MSLYSALTQVLAPFAARIKGIQTGYDGTEYNSPGEAVRGQINDLHVLIGHVPGRAIDASAVAYGDSDVGTELTNVNGRLDSLGDGVPTEVRQALLTLFQSAAYAGTGLSDEIAVIESWAAVVTAISLNQTSINISGANTSQLVATTTPAGGAVTWASSDTSVAAVSNNGLVTGVGNGTATITASCGGKTATCTATVTGFASLTGITANYTQSGTVYNTDTLDSLKSNLVVTANYSDSTTRTLSDSDYTLSGTLEVGTSTIVASYGGKTASFNVTVTLDEAWDYEWYASSGVAPDFFTYSTVTFAQDNSYATFHLDLNQDLFTSDDVGDMAMEFTASYDDATYNNNPQAVVRTSSTGGFKVFPNTNAKMSTNISGNNVEINDASVATLTTYRLTIENGVCSLKYGTAEPLTELTGPGQTNSQYYPYTGIKGSNARGGHNINISSFKYKKL